MLYKDYLSKILELQKKYPFLRVRSIGKSIMEREIYIIEYGVGSRKVQYTALHHAMEHAGTYVCFRYIEELCKYGSQRKYEESTLYFVPIVNPDGGEMQSRGGEFFYRWQANARGVDLNHNYDALWDRVYDIPGPTRFGGYIPESEPEVITLINEARKQKFDRVVAFHSQGEEIYWDFNKIYVEGAYELAKKIEEASGYKMAIPEDIASGGGYKDWFIQEFKKIGLTIELGKGENPLAESKFEDIYQKILPALNIISYEFE